MSSKQSSKKEGFTLLEMLIGVAVLVILLAVSIPSIIAASRNLNMTKLDEAAKEIFTAAQNRLTAMKASGELSAFSAQLNAAYNDRNLYETFTAAPADYPGGDSGWQGFFYLTSDDPVFQQYVMSDTAFQAIDGRYIVELDPDSGDVYSVFYGEYDSETEFVSTYEYSYYNRSEEDRRPVEMGYYSGSDLSAAVSPDSFKPLVTVHNNEELYLEITCGDMLQYTATRQYLTLKLTLTDEHGFVWEKTYNGLTDLTVNGDEIQLYVLLDTMRPGYSFSDLTGLTPGDNITAVATMEYSYRGKDITTDPEYLDNTRTFNSLFDSVSESNGSQIISISKLRHLNNLRSSIYGYSGSSVGQVLQTAPIDFDSANWPADEWCPLTESKTQPIDTFTPLVNDALFGCASASGSASFSGGEISNMIIGSGAAETGLFAHANCDLSGFRLIDPEINGGSYTGSLAGRVYGGAVFDCGVYLTNANKDGVLYDKDTMDARVEQYRINAASGSANIGGLVGAAQGSAVIEQSFAAINIDGSATNAGGLVGSFSGSAIEQSYSSGDLSVDAHAGGFVGVCSGGQITNCYTTSNTNANSYAGGFSGDAAGGGITGCVSYGVTKKADGTTDLSTSGPFTGSGGAMFSNDFYLRQNGYNSDYDNQAKIPGIESGTYASFLADPANSSSNSFPYSAALQGSAYPFRMLTGSHYGNWPPEATIETSLIYYEKYTNSHGSVVYGYYADGYANVGDDGTGVSAWNLDTLKTQSELDSSGYWLTEDGYAVLSIYNLVRINYSLNDASQKTLDVSGTPGTNRFVLIENPASLQFSTLDKDTGNVIGTFSVKYLYVFQLPFQLQETDRDATFTFYDKLKMTGYAKGNLSDTVFADYIFYYCPHFAKNAINPDVNQVDPGRPYYSENPTIYVRSARHLNALGRYSYYWSKVNAPYDSFTFSQEIDIDFSRYTKTYCGQTFNLMDTSYSNTYRNRPIGKPMLQSFTDPWGNRYSPGNFQNSYNGNGYQIIDYRLYCYASEDIQFAGLFGEIMNATIENVVMTASDPESQSGYVVSEYNSYSYRSPGTAALVGLSYAAVKTEQCTISNCAVSGYTVVYSISGTMVPDYSAVGGLVGYNMGVVTNCSADSYLVAAQVTNAGGNQIFVSGLIGSSTNGAISTSYAGGPLKMNALSGLSSSSSINGLTCYSYVWAPYSNGTFTVGNCYSFCTVNKTDSGYSTSYQIYGGNGNLSSHGTAAGCYYLNDTIDSTLYVSSGSGTTKLAYKQLVTLTLTGMGDAAVSHSFPWSATLRELPFPFPAAVRNAAGDYVHYGDWPAQSIQPEYIAYYELYSNGTAGVYYFSCMDDTDTATDTTRNDLAITKAGYGILRLASNDILYEATYKDAYDTPIELSVVDDPVATDLRDASGIRYTLYALTEESIQALTPDQTAIERLVEMTYHFKTAGGQAGEEKDGAPVYINPEFACAIRQTVNQMGRSDSVPLQVRTPGQLCAVNHYLSYTNLRFAQTHDIDFSGYLPESTASYIDTLSVGSVFTGRYNNEDYTLYNARLPLFGGNDGTVRNLTLSGAALSAADGTQALIVRANRGTVSGCTVRDSSLTLTDSATGAIAVAANSGTVTGTTADGCTVQGPAVAGFVYGNSGTIDGCTVIDSSVSSTSGDAAGFAYSNSTSATITGCAAVRTGVIADYARAAGFIVSNASGAALTSSYVGPAKTDGNYTGLDYGDVEITGASAFGFAADDMGGANLCFAVAQVESTAANGFAAGFAQNANRTSYCYANCAVSATGAGAVAAGFVDTGTYIGYSYACGSVSGPVSCGFMNDGYTVSYCYTISSPEGPEGATLYGFGPSSLSLSSDCIWVRDEERGFNTALDSAAGAGTVKTFSELSRTSSFITSAAANPFSDTNGTTYYYAVVNGLTHMGDWPANPAKASMQGYIGIAVVKKDENKNYTYTYYGYDCANEKTYSDNAHGPQITFSSGKGTERFYLYYSNDLSPAFGEGGWTYSSSRVSFGTPQASGTYAVCQVTFNVSYWNRNAYIYFDLDDTNIFTVNITAIYDWWGNLLRYDISYDPK